MESSSLVNNIFIQGCSFDEYGFNLMKEEFPQEYAEYMGYVSSQGRGINEQSDFVKQNYVNQGAPFEA